MENEHVVSGLIRKRGEMAGQIEAAQNTVRELMANLAHIDATLRLFQPNINLSGVKVRVVPGHAAALYGEMTRNIMDVLRGAVEPQSVRQITAAIVAKRGLAADDGDLIEALRKRVGSALRTCKARGTATSAHGEGLQLVWQVAPEVPCPP